MLSDNVSRLSKGLVDWKVWRRYLAYGRKQDGDCQIEMAKIESLVIFRCDGGRTMEKMRYDI